MSLPALRLPKIMNVAKKSKKHIDNPKYVILTLKNDTKLVVSSNSYNGIIITEDKYKCVFCGLQIHLENEHNKEQHIKSNRHRKNMAGCPHLEEFSENLLRKLKKDGYYCTVCNVIVLSQFLTRHTSTDVHIEELQKAVTRAAVYRPSN